MGQQKGMGWVWPDVSDENSAKEAARQGVWASALIAAITALVAFFGAMGLDQDAYIDAFVFAIIGFGIFRYSRTAAIMGLVIYIIERIYMWSTVGSKNIVMVLLFTLMFVNSIRGTFSYHKIKKQEKNPEPKTA